MKKKNLKKLVIYLVLTFMALVVMFPIYYAFSMSTLTAAESYSYPPRFIPGKNIFENYVTAWKTVNMGRLMLNSGFTAFVVATGKIGFAILAAFAFTYFGDFRGKFFFFGMILITHMLPLPVRILPTYELMKSFDWINTYYALTIPFFASATGTLLFRQLFLTVPTSLSDAARIDGAGPMRFLFNVLLPLSKTNMGALFLIEFNFIWNEYLWPLIITTTNDMRVVQIGIKMLLASEAQAAEWNIIMAGTITAMIVPLVMLLIFQKTFMSGFSLKEEK
ncbi:MAG TPA: ABC transporter permease subunit [Mesotoga infera]|jgi:sn-glycerol 3-phosphate transport system permease protein|uniref:Glycerol-3-phosphate transporter subunit membrane component of ABC superfamily n=1 Tax=Mesotoga infera TaxID=1236046 RepID=A0A7Z7LDM8_9BACT|nr:ABC transporter permease subunit [Mesotoga infera]MBP8660090.1 ABC transporter permease subunit [Mesotoga sp.]NLI05901.1 ABC transporter permease subunit [Thermotogaceae bacterium]SSC11661.1 glycerol-3-phosphate transporter subunit; membrane component of ABC superfamily [Mesotoga infera]HNR78852.1 ABC transporter permease subunit [Mesotoga infera]HNS66046.1 ABC transporter permease subunit [Mesotoga infera]